jgi:CRP-like cAMP-binding protein
MGKDWRISTFVRAANFSAITMTRSILQSIGTFSENDLVLFNQYTSRRQFSRNEHLLEEGAICRSVFYLVSGALYQYQDRETGEHIIDLHQAGEWVFNNTSLVSQSPSATYVKAFATSEVIELKLRHLHELIGRSASFLQLGRIFNQDHTRAQLFDQALSPAGKYRYIRQAKPLIAAIFPVKMIAAYLKIAPETLSRVRADFSIS